MSADTTRRSFLGIPVEGDVRYNKPRVEQKPITELEPLIRALLGDATIVAFGWTQYTPYFNDGEPCVFGVRGEPWFRTTADGEDGDRYDLGVSEYSTHPSLGGRDWDAPGRPYKGPDEARWRRCLAFAEALDSDAFDDVLLGAFGDHAEITITRNGITVDEYSHD